MAYHFLCWTRHSRLICQIVDSKIKNLYWVGNTVAFLTSEMASYITEKVPDLNAALNLHEVHAVATTTTFPQTKNGCA